MERSLEVQGGAGRLNELLEGRGRCREELGGRVEKSASTARDALVTFWLAGEHFGTKHKQFWCIFLFVTNHTCVHVL